MPYALLILLASLLLFLNNAQAQVQFSGLQHKGSGCPQGTVAISPSPDGSSVSILFDAFQVQVPQYDQNNDNDTGRRRGKNDSTLDHKACALSFNADLPEGQQVDSIEISLFNRGAVILDQGVQASLSTVFVGFQGMGRGAGGRPTVLERKLWVTRRSNINEDWISTPVMRVPIQSACASRMARSVRFDLKNHLEAEITNADLTKQGLVTMDSSDVNGALKFRVITRPCGGRTSPR
ncbi:MAG: DUF4360 domain-containing protein [Bacteriovoracaceae bacterium]|nr:DUF4360 domain-containing protein [Bacteriovoracaceae bacterium]